MERFSNNSEDYWKQIKKELQDFSDTKNIRFQYLQMGQTFSHGFCISQTKEDASRLIMRSWNAEYDNNRFDKGIFNLDRLAISNQMIDLSDYERGSIDRLLASEFSLTYYPGIVLDGLFCQMKRDGEMLNWNCNEEVNSALIEFVELLRSKAYD